MAFGLSCRLQSPCRIRNRTFAAGSLLFPRGSVRRCEEAGPDGSLEDSNPKARSLSAEAVASSEVRAVRRALSD